MTAAEARAVARIATRTARRNWKRTLLVVALVAVPVAAAQVAAGMVAAGRIAPHEFADSVFGTADAEIAMEWGHAAAAGWVEERVAALAPGAETLEYRTVFGRLGSSQERYTEISDLDLSHPLAEGKLALTAGRLPTAPAEAALGAADLEHLGLRIGDEVTVAYDGRSSATYQVVGAVRNVLYLDQSNVIVVPAALDPVLAEESAVLGVPVIQRWLLDHPNASQVADQIRAQWEATRVEFYPEPAVTPRPPLLASLPVDLYVQLSAAQVAELEQLAATGADPEMVIDAGYRALDGTGYLILPYVAVQTRADYDQGQVLEAQLTERPVVIGTLLAGLLLAEVALVAGAAYATGARRRLRELGLMSANGATTAHLRWSVVGEGVVAGALGAATGTVAAVAVFTLGRDVVQRFIERLIVGMPLSPVEFAGPAVAGALAATIAAWWPARSIATIPALTALAGRVPLAAPRRWVAPLGGGLAALGAFLVAVARTASGGGATLQATAGVVTMIAGFALLAGPLVALVGRHADRFPPVVRLVLRDSARQRTRAAAAVAATMVVLTGPVLLATALRTEQHRQLIWGLPAPPEHVLVFERGSYQWSEVIDEATVAAVAERVPGAQQATIHVLDGVTALSATTCPGALGAIRCGGMDGGTEAFLPFDGIEVNVALGTDDLVSALAAPGLADALREGPVVLGVDDRATEISIDGRTFAARELPVPVISYMMPRILVPEEFAAMAGLQPAGVGTLLVAAEPLSDAQRDAIASTPEATVAVAWPERFSTEQILWAGMGATALVVLLIVGLVTALAATESDHDLRTMVAVGASPRLRRRFLGTQTAYYTLFAALLATPLALLLLRMALSGDWVDIGPFGTMPAHFLAIPWDVLAVLAVGLPLAIGAVTAVLVRSSPTVPPRRAG